MIKLFDHIDANQFTASDFTDEFIKDLHTLVGVDAVTKFGELLEKHNPELFFYYLVRLQEYYWNQEENIG